MDWCRRAIVESLFAFKPLLQGHALTSLVNNTGQPSSVHMIGGLLANQKVARPQPLCKEDSFDSELWNTDCCWAPGNLAGSQGVLEI